MRILVFITSMLFAQFGLAQSGPRNVIVITDMEPDDRIALEIISARMSDRIQLIGTTVKNSRRKAALVRDQLAETGLSDIPVFAGAGGHAEDYTDIASSRAAREYSQEGRGILSPQLIASLNRNAISAGSDDFRIALEGSLKNAHRTKSQIEIILLAPPTDLVAVLDAEPILKNSIRHIYLMGGWAEVKLPNSDETEKRSTYNVNMDEHASARLMEMNDIPMTLYSSHIIKPNFAGGSVNASNYPSVISAIERSKVPSLKTFRYAGHSWDTHLMEKIPALKGVIGENAGRQFTPADPLVVVGILNPDLITASEFADVRIETSDLDTARGFRVDVSQNPRSKIRLVTAIDTQIFEVEMIRSLQKSEKNFLDRQGPNSRMCIGAFANAL